MPLWVILSLVGVGLLAWAKSAAVTSSASTTNTSQTVDYSSSISQGAAKPLGLIDSAQSQLYSVTNVSGAYLRDQAGAILLNPGDNPGDPPYAQGRVKFGVQFWGTPPSNNLIRTGDIRPMINSDYISVADAS